MNINLMQFQLKAIKALLESMEENCRDIILKSPTGSGKTIILTHFMDEYIKGHAKTVFVWLTPGKGNLEEQSKAKMDKYIHNSQTKLLADIMTGGFAANDCCFINWEKLTKKGNNALKDSERTNFLEWIEKAFNDGLSFKIIIDESHQNFTEKADAIVQLFKTDKIIRCSATPLISKTAKLIEVSEEDVIAEGLIKKLLVINENFPQVIEAENQTHYLLEKAYAKQRELRSLFLGRNLDINPLIVVQLPNNSDALCDTVEKWFENNGITVENETLAIWLSNRHESVDGISDNNAKSVAVIMKQAVATGWDCPRAHILVKLRENMDETFEVQTIGRIRRMPEAKHYGNDILDSCYLYTFDGKFTQGVKASLGKSALEAKTLFLKNEYKSFTLTKEQRTMVTDLRDPRRALTSIAQYFKREFSLTGDKKQNKIRLESKGFIFFEDIVKYTLSGNVVVLGQLSEKERLNVVQIKEPINTHIHGREYHNRVGKIGLEIGMEYAYMNTIIGKLFGDKYFYSEKLLSLSTRELYSFVINNTDALRHICREAMAAQLAQLSLSIDMISEKPFFIPQSMLFTFSDEGYDTWAHEIRCFDQKIGEFSNAEMHVSENGNVRVTMRVTSRYNSTILRQDFTLYKHSPILHVAAQVRDLEHKTMLRLSFPVCGENLHSLAEIPFGAHENPRDKGECPCGKWFSLYGEEGGVTVYNKTKSNYGVDDSTAYFTVLRASAYLDHFGKIDEFCSYLDDGVQEFEYGIAPFENLHDNACKAQEFTVPTRAILETFHKGELGSEYCGIKITTGTVALSAIKRAEDGKGSILRIYETSGKHTNAVIECDCLGVKIETTLHPYETKSFRIENGRYDECDFIEREI